MRGFPNWISVISVDMRMNPMLKSHFYAFLTLISRRPSYQIATQLLRWVRRSESVSDAWSVSRRKYGWSWVIFVTYILQVLDSHGLVAYFNWVGVRIYISKDHIHLIRIFSIIYTPTINFPTTRWRECLKLKVSRLKSEKKIDCIVKYQYTVF